MRNSEFELSIELLQSGWADLLLMLNEEKIMVCFENVPTDPLDNLLESAIKIAGNIDSSVIFPNKSQKTNLSVKYSGNNFCRVKIESSCMDLPIKHYCKAILRMFDKYIFTFSKHEYLKNWSLFPEAELERLRNLYRIV